MMRDEDAVGPVVGTILLVAIAVLMATAVFVAAIIMSGEKEPSEPPMALSSSNEQNRLGVVSSVTGVVWEQMEIQLSVDGGWAVNGVPDSGSSAQAWERMAGGVVRAGDYVAVCADGGAAHMTVEVRDLAGNLLVSRVHFSNVQAC